MSLFRNEFSEKKNQQINLSRLSDAMNATTIVLAEV
jgi:hypothetical protein